LEGPVWDYQIDTMSNVVDVYIRPLRRKLELDGKDSLLQIVRGAGYKMRVN
jgi:DNA-binding response OmpR family regulator